MRNLLVVLLVAAGCSAAAPAAPAASITYLCKVDLCRVAAGGGDVKRVTRDGSRKAYTELLSVRDSGLMAFERESDSYLARPDGRVLRRFGAGALYSTDARGYAFSPAGGSGAVCFGRVATPRKLSCRAGGIGVWWRTRRIFASRPLPGYGEDGICLVKADLTCRRTVAPPVGGVSFRRFDVSPDGRLLVAEEYPPEDGSRTRLSLYDVTRGRRVRTLTRGHDDESPSFSPDGRLVVFERDDHTLDDPPGEPGRICVLRPSGGKPRCVARGRDPVWTR